MNQIRAKMSWWHAVFVIFVKRPKEILLIENRKKANTNLIDCHFVSECMTLKLCINSKFWFLLTLKRKYFWYKVNFLYKNWPKTVDERELSEAIQCTILIIITICTIRQTGFFVNLILKEIEIIYAKKGRLIKREDLRKW